MISGEVGLYKPQPEIFQLGAERVGLDPSDCVFVDDLRENCEGAEAVGMTAVLHRGADGTLDAAGGAARRSACDNRLQIRYVEAVVEDAALAAE